MAHVPLKLRKQMLLMRAAVERVELAHHIGEVRRAATLHAIIRNALPTPSNRSRNWMQQGMDVVKRYPFVTSAVSLVATRFKIPLLKTAVKWGGMVGLGYKLYEAWQVQQRFTGRHR